MTENKNKKEIIVKLDMTFEQALKKALTTPLPPSEKRKVKKKKT